MLILAIPALTHIISSGKTGTSSKIGNISFPLPKTLTYLSAFSLPTSQLRSFQTPVQPTKNIIIEPSVTPIQLIINALKGPNKTIAGTVNMLVLSGIKITCIT